MAKQAVIEMFVVEIPSRLEGKTAHLGVASADYRGASPAERDRIARETGRASALVSASSSTPVQWTLLERLAGAAPNATLRFPHVVTLERFLDATRSLSAADAAALSDEAIQALWADAESRSS